MKKRKLIALTMGMVLGLSVVMTGCGSTEEVVPESETRMNPTIIKMSDVNEEMQMVRADGKVQNNLNGDWVDPEVNERKPVAIMINNIGEAMPQSGIGNADLIYEMIVEGGITRLEAVFTDYSGLTKIGPVRSARQYYVRNAEFLDAFYVHCGCSEYAENELAQGKVTDLDAMNAVGNYMTYRDSSRVAPHNLYTSEEGLNDAIDYVGEGTSHRDNYSPMFMFNAQVQDLANGKAANKITTAYNGSRIPWFEYNSEDQKYYRFQYGDKQIDDQTGEQLRFQNVLVLFATTYSPNGYLMEVENYKEGDGYYASNGSYIPIRWKCEDGTVHYYTEDGKRLRMNPGKTWITYFDDANREGVTFE